jgi:hypothetical protein
VRKASVSFLDLKITIHSSWWRDKGILVNLYVKSGLITLQLVIWERIKWKPITPCKLCKLRSEPDDVDPKESSWEVGRVICKSAFENHPSHLS